LTIVLRHDTIKVEVMRMARTAKEVLEQIIRQGLPPEGWGRWVWKGQDGYGISSLVPSGTLPPVEGEEQPFFWWGGVSLANVPYWPEAFLPSPDDGVEPGEEMEYAKRCLTGKLIGEAIRQLPDEDWEKFRDALLDLENSPETKLEAEIALNELYL
jgi:hypothetical protein